MPIFEYRCMSCGTNFEILVSTSESNITCGRCGSKELEKQFSTFSAGISKHTSVPCANGECPASGRAGTGCSAGGCAFSQQ